MSRRVRKMLDHYSSGIWTGINDEKYLYESWNMVCRYDNLAGGGTATSTPVLLATYTWGLDIAELSDASRASGANLGATAGGVGGLLAFELREDSRSGSSDAGVYAVTYDGNGNITGLIDVDGQSAANYEYGPFGERLRASGSAANACPFGFSTKYTDAETGLCYYGYRYYSPEQGRLLSRDPIGEWGYDGPNLRTYFSNSSVNYTDYLGFASVPAPNPFDPCKDPCASLLSSIRELARHVRGRYNDLLLDVNDLYSHRRTGTMSWKGHISQYEGRRKQLRKVIDIYNIRDCGQKMPLPNYVIEEVDRTTPKMPIRYEISPLERWIAYLPQEKVDAVENVVRDGAKVAVGVGITGLTWGIAGPYVAGAGGTIFLFEIEVAN